MTCDCRSYNGGVGTVPPVLLPTPSWSERLNGISIDACIAPAVEALWAAGHVTLGSCCSHGGRVCGDRPSLVLTDDETDFDAIRRVIATVDDRQFDLHQWRLITVPLEEGESDG